MADSESLEDIRRGIERAEEARHSALGTIRNISTPLHAALMSLHMDDVDPVTTCLVAVQSKGGEQCGWHAHGDSLNDAVLAWTKHLAQVHRDDWD
jgi:hypothetical protein